MKNKEISPDALRFRVGVAEGILIGLEYHIKETDQLDNDDYLRATFRQLLIENKLDPDLVEYFLGEIDDD
jgi:Fe-S cluster assembly iron-binding protein IscA